MRKTFSSLIEKISEDDSILFLTGDLGFNAFENLRLKMQDRFMNLGVAEQNMIGVAAGMAHKGFSVFCYSIAPFITYRCLEQIRIDVCFHKLPVFIVGNGGGFGYGIMGPTHHGIADLACMSSLPEMTCYIPAFNEDVEPSLSEMILEKKPSYLRLGFGKSIPENHNHRNDIRCISDPLKAEITVLALGPVIHNAIDAISIHKLNDMVSLFSAIKIPMKKGLEEFIQNIVRTKKLIIVEEHVKRGGISEYIALALLQKNIQLDKFHSFNAHFEADDLSGNQSYYQMQSGLDARNIGNKMLEWIKR